MSGTNTDAGAVADKTVAATAAATAETAANTVLTHGGGANDNTGAATTGADPKAAAPATWPEDWRKQLAGEDAATLKRMERFGSPADVWKSYRALEQRVSSGELKAVKPEPAADAKPEDVAAWRKEMGIPEKVDGYLEGLPDGVTIGERDKPLINTFVGKMHELHAPPKIVHGALQAYYQVQQQVLEEMAERDVTTRQSAEDTLRAEWGNDYRGNINAVGGLLRAQFGDMTDNILNARTPDGVALFNQPDIVKGLLSIAKEMNPAATIVPGAAGNPGKGIDDRIAEIEGVMRKDRRAYDKNEKMQAELRDLYDARERIQRRAA